MKVLNKVSFIKKLSQGKICFHNSAKLVHQLYLLNPVLVGVGDNPIMVRTGKKVPLSNCAMFHLATMKRSRNRV